MKWNRVLLKLSGEALAGPKTTGFDEDTVKAVAAQVAPSVREGIQIGIVIGGGNFWRGRQSKAIDRTKADRDAGHGHELHLRIGDFPLGGHGDGDIYPLRLRHHDEAFFQGRGQPFIS